MYSFAAVTHGVVTPNIVAATKGFLSRTFLFSNLTIPTIANTAFVNIFVEIELRPATSTIDGIITISLVPTY